MYEVSIARLIQIVNLTLFLEIIYKKGFNIRQYLSYSQGFCLASALGLSPKIVTDVRELAVQFGQFVRDDFRKCTRYGNAQ